MILVTGAAGKTGRAVIGALHSAGLPVRGMVQRADSARRVLAAGADDVAVGDMTRPGDVRAALESVDGVYLVCPNMAPNEVTMAGHVIEACRREGVDRVVYHSVLHPQTESMPHHWQKMRVEEQLFESGLDITILQPAPYIQNIKGYWDEITSLGVYRVPYPVKTRLSLVDLDDVALSAAAVVGGREHYGATYELCGPDAPTQADVAALLTEIVGQPVAAEAMPIDVWLDLPAVRGMGAYPREALAAMFRYYGEFGLVGSPNVLRWLLGRSPTGITEALRRDLVDTE